MYPLKEQMNYIVSMVAEDLIGCGNSLVNVNPKTTQVQLDEYRRPVENGVISSVKKYPQNFVGNEYQISSCDDNNEKFKKFSENPEIYDNDPDKSAAHNKTYRIQKILSEDIYLKCVQQNSVDATGASLSSTQDIKSIEVFKICNGLSIGCTTGTTTDFIFDETYIGRVQISTNNGRKKKTLYFLPIIFLRIIQGHDQNLKSESGVSLIELLVGVAVTALMMGAMLATYTVVNNSYRQVLDKASISSSSRYSWYASKRY